MSSDRVMVVEALERRIELASFDETELADTGSCASNGSWCIKADCPAPTPDAPPRPPE